jgi:hypothetical protein
MGGSDSNIVLLLTNSKTPFALLRNAPSSSDGPLDAVTPGSAAKFPKEKELHT